MPVDRGPSTDEILRDVELPASGGDHQGRLGTRPGSLIERDPLIHELLDAIQVAEKGRVVEARFVVGKKLWIQ